MTFRVMSWKDFKRHWKKRPRFAIELWLIYFKIANWPEYPLDEEEEEAL